MGLQEYKGIIGMAASTASIGFILSPMFLCLQILQRKSSKETPFAPLMEGLSRGILIFQQGLLLGIRPMMITNFIGITLHTVYICVYLSFCIDKSEAKKVALKWIMLLVPMIAYANYEDKELVGTRFASLVTIYNFGVIFYHLYKVIDVIKIKNTKDLPFPILVAAWFTTFFWFLYAIAINQVIIQIQTGLALIFVSFQLSLFAVYPSKPPIEGKKKTK